MNETYLTYAALAVVAFIVLNRMGYLRQPSARPTPTQVSSTALAAPTQTLVLKHEVSAAQVSEAAPRDAGPVHETEISVPMTIRVIPRGPASN